MMSKKQDLEFIFNATKHMSSEGVDVIFCGKDYVESTTGSRSNGYFSHIDKQIKVATNKEFDKWYEVFVHEYCHFLQWLNKTPCWLNCETPEGDTTDVILAWLNGEDINEHLLKSCVVASRDVELDCEKRVFEFKKLLNISINNNYARTANAYILFYNFLHKHRKWYIVGREPYRIKEVFENLPNDFTTLDYSELPEDYEQNVLRYCFD